MNPLSYWNFAYPRNLAYMMQASGYDIGAYIAWWARTRDFGRVSLRGQLEPTSKAKLMLGVLTFIYAGGVASILTLLVMMVLLQQWGYIFLIVLTVIAWPIVVAFAGLPVLWVGEVLIQRPKEQKLIEDAKLKAGFVRGLKIAVAGSYGKSSMKEMLQVILSEKFFVRATPGNKNTPLGTAEFIATLSDAEDVVIFELGESHVGDITELCDMIQPKLGIITGIAEAHLETFGSRENMINTIFELVDYLGDERVYKNADSRFIGDRTQPHDPKLYSIHGCHGWKVSDISQSLAGIRFTAHKGEMTVHAQSSLIGEHHIGPLVACIDIAQTLGVSVPQIEAGIQKTRAFEHRMQPYELAGATIIDDTYNGNPAGVFSGLDLLKSVNARRRIYVTPGLVELGDKSAEIHLAIGKKIAHAADVVVLMKNSTTDHIHKGLLEGGFSGRLILIDDPLQFYTHLDQFVAAGDVVLMQNDWTDNYA